MKQPEVLISHALPVVQGSQQSLILFLFSRERIHCWCDLRNVLDREPVWEVGGVFGTGTLHLNKLVLHYTRYQAPGSVVLVTHS